MTNSYLDTIDVRLLRYFAVVAEECNLRRAAQRLFMSQPPLSRHMKNLEEYLGVTLFTRHTKGLTLTNEGTKVLQTIQPLLRTQESVYEQLREFSTASEKRVAVGLTTAFEQGTFTTLEKRLREYYGERLRLVRSDSLKLVRDVKKGKLDAAFVALPLDAPGLELQATHYAEPLFAVLPSHWLEAEKPGLALKEFNGKPLFWFHRDSNPAFFDFTKTVFAHAGYEPLFMEEPEEHDVLLARIAAGEGIGLFAASFAAISRKGVTFSPVAEGELLRLALGITSLPGNEFLAQELVELAAAALPTP
ncbi:LysR family transcriptional regulator [Desulfovibrio cuneatus]|uniref:LysR family transcriptional regulator n=1 Tax=Desulfovibrio cuneatus TaxID=159728 RepID=UPI00040776D0|nr:LysR family transcriptional regulator [Desulfovibrio cuneatus]